MAGNADREFWYVHIVAEASFFILQWSSLQEIKGFVNCEGTNIEIRDLAT